MSGRAAPLWEAEADRYPLEGFVTSHATSLLVHSHHMAEAVGAYGRTGDIVIIPFPARQLERPKAAAVDRDRPVTLGVFGFITPNKRVPNVLAAFRTIFARVPQLRLLIVGGSAGVDVTALSARMGFPSSAIRVEEYSVRSRYDELLSEVDIGISLRHPTFGETSAAVIDFMVHGIPVIVSTGGWYDELPSAAVARVAPDRDEVLTLAATIEHLVRDPGRRQAMGEAAFDYTRTALNPSRTAEAYLRALLGPVGRQVTEESLRRSLARSIGEVGTVLDTATEPLARTVGAAAGEIGLLPSVRR
jgi:glycosyltransferase involved in cell wall biosynthesis